MRAADVAPERLDLGRGKHGLPRWHRSFAVVHRSDKARLVVGWEAAKVEYARGGADHIESMAARAVLAEDPFAIRGISSAVPGCAQSLCGRRTARRTAGRDDRGQCESNDRRARANSSNHFESSNAKVHTELPGGTEPSRGSPLKSGYTPPTPLVTVTYCLPSRSHVIGIPMIPDPVWNFQSCLPSLLAKAMNSPVMDPVNTSPPSVLS